VSRNPCPDGRQICPMVTTVGPGGAGCWNLSRRRRPEPVRFRAVDARPRTSTAAADLITLAELRLAARNRGTPLEALRHPVTPTGLHYLLVHFDIPFVDAQAWRLEVDGAVHRSLSVTLPDLRSRPTVTRAVTMECAGNGRTFVTPRAASQPWLYEGVGTAEWSGTPLWPLLAEAGVADDATEVAFVGLDRGMEDGQEQQYARSLPLPEARRPDVLLAHSINGQPLTPEHGHPLRLVVPGWYGMASVKWLERITVLTEPFTGPQQIRSYRLRQRPDESGVPVSRMAPRALMVPPGIPDFQTRRRFLPRGRTQLAGRAWSGWGPVVLVEVSTDGGHRWAPARLAPPPAPHVWQAWSYSWDAAEPGNHELCCRATDAGGRTQPAHSPWNLGGYAGNGIHRVAVTVTPTSGDAPAPDY
jgi:sulfane dehydrogenase subunit SoxC